MFATVRFGVLIYLVRYCAFVQEESQTNQNKVTGLQYQLHKQRMEIITLQENLHKARLAGDPSVIQLKQLLLDPALQKEFRFLKAEVEEKKGEIKKLQEELDGVTFTQESKAGKLLVAKCKKLQVCDINLSVSFFFE